MPAVREHMDATYRGSRAATGPLSHCLLVVLLLRLLQSGVGVGVNVTVVRFQDDGKATPDSMLDTSVGLQTSLTQMTVCARYRLLHYAEFSSSILSYFAAETNNELFLEATWEDQSLKLQCCNQRVKMTFHVPVVLYAWHHLCLALHLLSRRFSLAYDDTFSEGHLEVKGDGELLVRGGGRLVIGQDLDTLEGGFTIRQGIHGDVANFLLYAEALSPAMIKEYVRCRKSTPGVDPIVYFDKEMSHLQVMGSTKVHEANLEDLCVPDKFTGFVFIDARLSFQESRDFCSKIKSKMAVPMNDDENTDIYHEFIRFNDKCVEDYDTLYWLGVKGDTSTGQWLSVANNKLLIWEKFAKGYNKVKSSQQCASVGGIQFPMQWYSTPCEYRICPLCSSTVTPMLRLRGLCEQSVIDNIFFLHGYENSRILFKGIHYTKIFWDNETSIWKLTSRAHDGLMGVMAANGPNEYPVGVHKWTIKGDECNDEELDVLITACTEGEYTCNDGICINKTKRCDLATDCPDQSDEFNCRLANIPDGYTVEMPPPKIQDLPVPVRLFAEITSVREISILGFRMVLDVILRMYWRDGRLVFKNLRENLKSNKIREAKEVWLPQLQVEDGTRSLVTLVVRSETLMVEREGASLPDDLTRINEDNLYLGYQNTLTLQQVLTVDFSCQFQLHYYPFDSQVCSVAFNLASVSSSSVVLEKDGNGVSFTGRKRLLEYEVTTFNMTSVKDSQGSGQRVSLELRNLFGYYIISTYVPTLLMVAICYLTLFFDMTDFTDRVMVSLTSLLVLTTLFSQTSQTIPKTAYLKLIDLWFVTLIVMVFFIVLILVIVENLRLRLCRDLSRQVRVIPVAPAHKNIKFANSSHGDAGKNETGRAEMINKLAIVILPLVMATFTLGYSVFCIRGDM